MHYYYLCTSNPALYKLAFYGSRRDKMPGLHVGMRCRNENAGMEPYPALLRAMRDVQLRLRLATQIDFY